MRTLGGGVSLAKTPQSKIGSEKPIFASSPFRGAKDRLRRSAGLQFGVYYTPKPALTVLKISSALAP